MAGLNLPLQIHEGSVEMGPTGCAWRGLTNVEGFGADWTGLIRESEKGGAD